MVLDNTYHCDSVDAVTSEMVMRSITQQGTVIIVGHGLVNIEVGKTYHVHIDVALWSGNHRIEFTEVK